MVDRSYRVYVVQGQVERDWSDCQAALDGVPARVTTLPFVADPDVLIARARDADALVDVFSPITRGVMSALEGLKTVVRTGVGYDVIDVPAATANHVWVTNTPGVLDEATADFAFALMVATARRIVQGDTFVRQGNFKGWEIIIVLALLLLLFGAKRLPDAARGLGRSLRIFKAETKGLRDEDLA